APPQIVVEAVTPPSAPQFMPLPVPDPEKEIPIPSEISLPIEAQPKGFRRTSRPETYAGDDSYLNRNNEMAAPKMPLQIPKPPPGRTAESVIQQIPKTEPAQQIEMPQNNFPAQVKG